MDVAAVDAHGTACGQWGGAAGEGCSVAGEGVVRDAAVHDEDAREGRRECTEGDDGAKGGSEVAEDGL